ncbi:hypothetical protein ACFYNU_26575 [Streptomyces sp. NPDC006643]|uniref:phosphoketolase family protein n=1 Tax=Streptomyces sp. NPDC006643 TaxID=3364756 RepID=UPI0036A73D14
MSQTTTTPFNVAVRNDFDRYRLVVNAIDRVPGLRAGAVTHDSRPCRTYSPAITPGSVSGQGCGRLGLARLTAVGRRRSPASQRARREGSSVFCDQSRKGS